MEHLDGPRRRPYFRKGNSGSGREFTQGTSRSRRVLSMLDLGRWLADPGTQLSPALWQFLRYSVGMKSVYISMGV